ncbi:DUF3368 domain-containing protein [Candidatus Woesearchaeota archaeon]|nr:DUF3368 domain-containing protein [Candidatus Woesearchaeota archaeon]
MKVISNASPLIFLGKINKLDVIEDYEVIMPKQVYEEIMKGAESGREDVHKIQELINKGIIKVEEIPVIKELKSQNIGNGEKAAISLAIDKKISLIFLNERKARRLAKFYKLRPRGTIGILCEAYKNNKINKKELKDLIQRLIKEGYRIREELIMEILKNIG